MDPSNIISNKETAMMAVKRHGWILQYANKTLRRDKEVVLAAVNQFGLALQYADDLLRKDPEIALAAIKKNRMAFQYADGYLAHDSDFVHKAVQLNGRALDLADRVFRVERELVLLASVRKHGWPAEYLNPSLWKSKDFVMEQVQKDGTALECAAEHLQQNEEVVLAAVKQHRWALRYAHESLRKNPEIVIAAKREHGWALDAADKSLWANRDFVYRIVAQNADAFRFADVSLRSDPEYVLKIAKANGWAIKYAANDLRKNPAIRQAAFDSYGAEFDIEAPEPAISHIEKISYEELLADPSKKIIGAWSGGKDGCLALHRALKKGNSTLGYLLNTSSKQSANVSFHEIKPDILKAQMELTGVPYIEIATTQDGYQQEYYETLNRLVIPRGLDILVFGNIYVDEHRTWAQNVGEDVGLEAIDPLWNENTESLFNELLQNGIESRIICANAGLIDKSWVGKKIDSAFLDYAKSRGIDPCGEYGEFHTFVTASPLFKGRIEFINPGVIKKGDYWVLDIKDYAVVPT